MVKDYGSTLDLGEELKNEQEEEEKKEQVATALEKRRDEIENKKELSQKAREWKAPKGYAPIRMICLIILLILLGAYVRLSPLSLGSTDLWAAGAVASRIKEDLSLQVNQEYTLADDATRQGIVLERLRLEFDTPKTEKEIKGLSEYAKSQYRDQLELNYLPGIKPYINYQEALQIVENGHPGTEIEDNKNIDKLQSTPKGAEVSKHSMPYLLSKVSRLSTLPSQEAKLIQAAQYFPVVIGILLIILSFFIGRMIGGDLEGFFIGLIMALHPILLRTTMAGAADSVAIASFALIVTIFFVVVSFTYRSKLIILIGGIAASAAALAWFMRMIMVDMVVTQDWLPFPSPLQSFLEYQQISLSTLKSVIGGQLFYWICILAVFYMAIHAIRKREKRVMYSFIIVICGLFLWLALGQGRYLTLFMVPFTIILGCFIAYLSEGVILFIKSLGLSFHGVSQEISRWIIAALFAALLVLIVSGAVTSAVQTLPVMSDAFYSDAQNISFNSKEDAIINTWWDIAPLYRTYANRATLYRSGEADGRIVYFFSRALMAENEAYTIGVLRMLDCGNTETYNLLAQTTTPSNALAMIEQMTVGDLIDTKQLVREKNLPQEIVQLTKCNPPEAFLILTEDIIRQAGIIQTYASWDVKAMEEYHLVQDLDSKAGALLLQKRYNYSEQEAQVRYITLIKQGNKNRLPGEIFLSDSSVCKQKDHLIVCENGFSVNLEKKQATSPQGSIMSYQLYSNGSMYQDNRNTKYVIVVYSEGNNLRSIITNEGFQNTILFRLWYLNGYGLTHFESFTLGTSGLTQKVKVIEYCGLIKLK